MDKASFTLSLEYKCAVKVKAKLSLCLTKQHNMKAYWGVGE